jgi:hypothetical protein
MPLAQMKF